MREGKNMKNILLFASLIMIALGCNSDSEDPDSCREQPDVSDISIDVNIQRLDKKVFEVTTPAELGSVFRNNPVLARYFLPDPAMVSDTGVLRNAYRMVNDKSLDTLYMETEEVFGDTEELAAEFEEAFKNFKHYVPSFTPPDVKMMVTGFAGYADLYVSDSILLVGADYFLGPEATFRPVNTPEYLLRRYSPEYVVPSSVLFLSQGINSADQSDNTLLSDMIYYGKSYYFVSRVIPCLPDSMLLGYTGREVQGARFNRAQIWKHFIDNDLLYETNHFIKSKYTGERPKTFEISNDAPGRVGIWLGLDIVREYVRNNPDIPLMELMQNADAQDIFENSRYRPDRD